jgi:hypothetical protein
MEKSEWQQLVEDIYRQEIEKKLQRGTHRGTHRVRSQLYTYEFSFATSQRKVSSLNIDKARLSSKFSNHGKLRKEK